MTGQTPGGSPAVLEVAGVDVRFEGVVALDGVSLTVGANRIVGVIGPNGAGKTTLFNAISRFVTPVHGTIVYRGQSLLGLPAWRLAHLGIARTLQGLGLWPALTVLENVMAGAPVRTRLAADMFAFPSADRRNGDLRHEAMANLEELGVADRAHALPGALPHGVQKRVIIARALMTRPSLLLLDEPASGLSTADVAQLVDLIRGLRERMAIAIVEHNVDMVLAVSDSITVLNLGRVLATGSPDDIRGNADVATAYLGQQVAHA
ncbi:MAG: ABC transporter ATP-binding protein [Candidatus Dormiibacterota bacterium]